MIWEQLPRLHPNMSECSHEWIQLICFQLTNSYNVRHSVRVLNPKEECNQRSPIFPNRTPGRQPSISHGCKVVGSTFFALKIPKTSQNCSWKLNSTEHVWIWVKCDNSALIVLGATFSSGFFSFFFSPVLERKMRISPPPSLAGGSAKTPASAGCKQLPRRSRSVYSPAHGAVCLQAEKPSRTPALRCATVDD